ncbi:putative quinol monooxygenase [Burkholderia sp. F1]|uniref:putative quinol monooxygenase n=1 Tax=Burkholderia sp. F1 TaxID=3366817 RepID=UPI003D71CEDB
MSVSLIVLIEVQPGKANQQLEAFQRIAPMVRAEPGCIEYQLHHVSETENQFVLTERWETEEALAAHEIAPHMIEANGKNKSFRAGPAKVLKLVAV